MTVIKFPRKVRPLRARTKVTATKIASVRESRVLLFGSPNDTDVKESIRKAELTGRKVEVIARPSFDTGLGPCGKHVCSCKEICKADYARSLDKQFGPADYQLGN